VIELDKVKYFLVIVRDISEKKKIENNLNNILDLMSDGYWLVNSKGILIDVNASYCKMSGFIKEEIVGKKISELQILDDEEEVKLRLAGINEHCHDKFISKHLKKDGSFFYCDVIAKRIQQEDEYYFICNIRDITEKIIFQEAIIKEKNKTKAIAGNSFDIIHILSEEGVILYENKAVERILGYRPGELIGINAFDYVHPDDIEFITKEFRELVKNINSKTVVKFRYKHKNGSWIWFETSGQNLLHDENINGILINSRDITKQKKIEEELLISKELAEKANKAKSEFLSNMSHEIRTPMNGINGFIDILLEMEINENKMKYLKIVKESSDTLLRIINDILSISKIEAGKYKIRENKVNLYKILETILKNYKYQVERKGLNFNFFVDENINKEIWIDDKSVSQILNNLFSNALKFTEKGSISIVAKEAKNNQIEFIIRDTGIGINEKKQKHLFEPFEQGEHSFNKNHVGTGLGLAIVKRIIDLLGGKIYVDTEIGKGTEFSVIIPLKESKNNIFDETVSKDRLILKDRLKIISAEDVEINQKLLESIFRNENIFLKKVYNGKELIEELDREDYHLILMDIQMPILNGIEATKKIRRHDKHKGIPIIAVSAYAFEENVEEMKKAGVNDFILKPIKKGDLMNKIDKWAMI